MRLGDDSAEVLAVDESRRRASMRLRKNALAQPRELADVVKFLDILDSGHTSALSNSLELTREVFRVARLLVVPTGARGDAHG